MLTNNNYSNPQDGNFGGNFGRQPQYNNYGGGNRHKGSGKGYNNYSNYSNQNRGGSAISAIMSQVKEHKDMCEFSDFLDAKEYKKKTNEARDLIKLLKEEGANVSLNDSGSTQSVNISGAISNGQSSNPGNSLTKDDLLSMLKAHVPDKAELLSAVKGTVDESLKPIREDISKTNKTVNEMIKRIEALEVGESKPPTEGIVKDLSLIHI